MTEILEYTLAVMVSTILIGASIATYDGFASVESKAEEQATFSSIVVLAEAALTNGSSSNSLSMPNSTVSCRGETLGLTAGGVTETASVGAVCAFKVEFSPGVYDFRFTYDAGNLSLAVT